MKTKEEILGDKSLKYKCFFSNTDSMRLAALEAMDEYAAQSKWIELGNEDTLPQNEVLAINKNGYKALGILRFKNNMFVCENEHEVLQNVTHYQSIKPLYK